jgi:toxin-antitoxin system PIN domain toxin
VRFVVDTNVLAYAVNRDCDEHRAARRLLEDWLAGSVPWALTWGIVYEFLRVTTHPRIFRRPLTATQAFDFLDPIVGCEVVNLLEPTARHGVVLRETAREFGRPTGDVFHDLHTAVLMREHGIGEIMTADSDFRKFAFLTVTDPVHRDR